MSGDKIIHNQFCKKCKKHVYIHLIERILYIYQNVNNGFPGWMGFLND